jgi:hypothetical protein
MLEGEELVIETLSLNPRMVSELFTNYFYYYNFFNQGTFDNTKQHRFQASIDRAYNNIDLLWNSWFISFVIITSIISYPVFHLLNVPDNLYDTEVIQQKNNGSQV